MKFKLVLEDDNGNAFEAPFKMQFSQQGVEDAVFMSIQRTVLDSARIEAKRDIERVIENVFNQFFEKCQKQT